MTVKEMKEMEFLKKVWNTNLTVDETIRLLNSMILSGEQHSSTSLSMVETSLNELNLQRERLKEEIK
jgi:hypothetical protein